MTTSGPITREMILAELREIRDGMAQLRSELADIERRAAAIEQKREARA